jgi:hypothetical protein
MERPIVDRCEHHELSRNKTSHCCYPSLVVFYEELFVFYEETGYNEEIAETYGGCGHKSTKESTSNH